MAVFTNPDSAAILWGNFLKTATIISYPSNLSSYTPISNILLDRRSKMILLTNNNGGSLIFDLGEARRPTAIAIVDTAGVITNPTSAQQWSLIGADDAAFTTNIVSWVFPLYSNNITRYFLGPDKLAGIATFSNTTDISYGVVLDSNNKIIIGSRVSGVFREVRFLADGDLDISFGSGGYTDTAMTGSTELGYDLIKDSNNKRVHVGSTVVTGNTKAIIARFADAGTLDTTFDTDGMLDFAVSSDTYVVGKSVVEQSGGHYVVFGQHDNSSTTNNFFFWRCTSTGASPTSLADLTGSLTPVNASRMTKNSSDQPIGIGSVGTFAASKMIILRANSTISALDTTFNTTGKFEYQFNLSSSLNVTAGYDVAVQSTNKIIGVGVAYYDNPITGSSYGVWGAIRVTTTGTLDTSFGINGRFIYDWGGAAEAYNVKVLSDDSILIGGFGYKNGLACLAIIKLTSSGQLDTSFGDGGIFTANAGATDIVSSEISIQSNGKILFTGYFQNYLDTDNTLFVVRLTSNGQLDDDMFATSEPNEGRRYWKVNIGTTSNTPSHTKIGYLFLGEHVDIRPDLGTGIDYVDDSPSFISRAGIVYRDNKVVMRDIDIPIDSLDKTELENLRIAMNEVGNHSPVILDLFSNSSDTNEMEAGSVYGYFEKSNYFNIDLKTANTDSVKLKFIESPD